MVAINRFALACTALVFSTVWPAMAQHHGHGPRGHADSQAGPYAGMQGRAIKALSPQQIDGLLNGRGMGMAMPAELNGYPGPLHVLELAAELKLSDLQAARTRELYAEMLKDARAAGQQVIDAERELDALFADKKATRDNVAASTAKAAAAHGRLRATHLRYHLSMMEILSAGQVAQYEMLRGY